MHDEHPCLLDEDPPSNSGKLRQGMWEATKSAVPDTATKLVFCVAKHSRPKKPGSGVAGAVVESATIGNFVVV